MRRSCNKETVFFLAAAGALLHPQLVELYLLLSPLDGLNYLPGFVCFAALACMRLTEKRAVDVLLRGVLWLGFLAGVANIPFLYNGRFGTSQPVLAAVSLAAQMAVVVALWLWMGKTVDHGTEQDGLSWAVCSSLFLLCDAVLLLQQLLGHTGLYAVLLLRAVSAVLMTVLLLNRLLRVTAGEVSET